MSWNHVSFSVGHHHKNNVIFTAGAKSCMCFVSQWSCLYCDSSSAFNFWGHCHLWGYSLWKLFHNPWRTCSWTCSLLLFLECMLLPKIIFFRFFPLFYVIVLLPSSRIMPLSTLLKLAATTNLHDSLSDFYKLFIMHFIDHRLVLKEGALIFSITPLQRNFLLTELYCASWKLCSHIPVVVLSEIWMIRLFNHFSKDVWRQLCLTINWHCGQCY